MIINNFLWVFFIEGIVCLILSIDSIVYSENGVKRKFKQTFFITMLLFGNILAGYVELFVTIGKEEISEKLLLISAVSIFIGLFGIFLITVAIQDTIKKSKVENKKTIVIQAIVILFLSITISSLCFKRYNDNFEIISSETVENVEERKFLTFYDLPVQEISGKLKRGTGEINTENKIPYWYFTSEKSSIYDTAPETETEIIFLDKCETPYLEIISHRKAKEARNCLNGRVSVLEEEKYKEYKFYFEK